MVCDLMASGVTYRLVDLQLVSWGLQGLALAEHVVPLAGAMHPVGRTTGRTLTK